MPQHSWKNDPYELMRTLELRGQSRHAVTLYGVAAETVDGLYYIDDVDLQFEASPHGLGYPPHLKESSHARWATAAGITAIDLCAAGLGRTFCGNSEKNEFDLRYFNSQGRHKGRWRGKLPVPALQWVDSVLNDPNYQLLIEARHALTHAYLPGGFVLSARFQRRIWDVNGKSVNGRTLITLARDVAKLHVESLLELLPSI